MLGGRCSAFASRKVRCGRRVGWEVSKRARPAESMEGFMSEIVIWGGLEIRVGCVRKRRGMSPVPPAMSRIRRGGEGEEGGEGGRRDRTKWSFHSRWIPRDIRSFIVS